MITLIQLQFIAQNLPALDVDLTDDEANFLELLLIANTESAKNFKGTIKLSDEWTEESAKAVAKSYFSSIIKFCKTGAAYIRPRKNGFSIAFSAGISRPEQVTE